MTRKYSIFCVGSRSKVRASFCVTLSPVSSFSGRRLCFAKQARGGFGGGYSFAPCPPCAGNNRVFFWVTFDSNGGAPVPAPQTAPYGGMAARPADPVRAGYGFSGWYAAGDFSGSTWDFGNDTVTDNLTLYARWLQPA